VDLILGATFKDFVNLKESHVKKFNSSSRASLPVRRSGLYTSPARRPCSLVGKRVFPTNSKGREGLRSDSFSTINKRNLQEDRVPESSEESKEDEVDPLQFVHTSQDTFEIDGSIINMSIKTGNLYF